MDRKLFISGIVILAIASFVFMAGYKGIQDVILKFIAFSPEKYQLYEMMETIGGTLGIG